MTKVSKEYEIKTKMEQEQRLQLKMLFVMVYNEHWNRQYFNEFRFEWIQIFTYLLIFWYQDLKTCF